MSFFDNIDPHIYNSPDFWLLVAMGEFPGIHPVNVFGSAPDGIQTTITDLWDRADSTPTQQVWTQTTEARIHQIVSTSTDDSSGGVGAKTVRIFGLRTWNSSQVYEDIELNGTTGVNTINSYVIINNMTVLTYGDSGPNVGIITATAETDSTVSAQINAGVGSTKMAIFGFPSTQTLYINEAKLTLEKAVSNVYVKGCLCFNRIPDTIEDVYISIGNTGVINDGTSNKEIPFKPPIEFNGPCIVKLRAWSNQADVDGTGMFNGCLIDNI